MPLLPKPVREEMVDIKETAKKKLKSKNKKKIGASKHQRKRTTLTKAKTPTRRKKRDQKREESLNNTANCYTCIHLTRNMIF
jgi:hypothetical protein